ncbi:HU family DNA-binding protein [Streptomyces sp. NPDC004014]
MDKSKLIEMTARRQAERAAGEQLGTDEVGRVLDTLFGTVEHAETIAEVLKAQETVTLGSFGSFHVADGTAAFRPGKALTEYLRDQTG